VGSSLPWRLEALRRRGGEDVAHHRHLPARMRLLQTPRDIAVEDPDLLRPAFARAVERVALLALALAKAVRLAEIDAVVAFVEEAREIAVDALLHVGVRQAILRPAALRLQTRAADQREVFRVLRKQLRRHRPLPCVPAELLVHARKAIVREIIKRSTRWMRRIHPQQWRGRHIQRLRHRHCRHRQKLDRGQRQQVDLRRPAHRRVARQIGIQKPHAHELPRKIHRRLRRAHAIPIRSPRIVRRCLRRMIMPRDDHILTHHPMHKAPIPQLRHVEAVLLRELRVPEHQRRLRRIPLLFPHDRDLGLVRQKRRLEQSRRLHETFVQSR